MAKVIFNKAGGIYRIARDEEFMNQNKNFIDIDYNILDITTEEFNDIKYGVKKIVSHNDSTVTFETISYSLTTPGPQGNLASAYFSTEESLKNYLNETIDIFEFYLNFNSDKPLVSEVTSYLPVLKALDVSSLIPLNKTLEKYLSEQGNSVLHPLELI